MSINKFLDPKNDLAFKRVFGSEKNKDILLHFLNDIFASQTGVIQSITFLKPIQEPEIASQRVSLVDIMCQGVNGDRFIVEMQVMHEPGFEKRAQFYAARAYIDQRQAGVAYSDLKQVIFLAITDFVLFPNKPDYLSYHHVLDTKTLERDLKDFSFSFLELPKFKLQKNELKTIVEKWAYFFRNAQETDENDINKIAGSHLVIKEAFEQLNRFAWSPEELRTYDSIDMKIAADRAILEGAKKEGLIEGLIKGKKEGLIKGEKEGLIKGKKEGLIEGKKEGLIEGKKEGLIEGVIQGKLEIARKLLKDNYPIEMIAQITELTTEQINDLR